jgi:hypothetical protein
MKIHVKLIWVLIIISPFLQGFGCGDNRLVFNNNSNSDIYILFSCHPKLDDVEFFRPEYFWVDHLQDSVYTVSEWLIRQKSSQNIIMRGSWPDFIRECDENRIYFFVFSDSIVMNYSDKEILEKELYEKPLEYTLDELRKNNWVINFP